MQATPAHRWRALAVLCLGVLMIVLDTTVVNVALPSIRADLGFDEASLVWVINAYMLTFGGFLLLGGRLGDLYGPRRLFVGGVALFTLASVACGLADSQGVLIGARALQGVGGAVVDAVSLSLIVNLFDEPGERARAMGVYGFVCACGGSIGVLLGGLLTSALGWHTIFLVNLPIGVAVVALSLRWVPAARATAVDRRLDWPGAATITASLLLAVYAVVDGNAAGWTSTATLARAAGALALFVVFIAIEMRSAQPMVPLALFRRRNLALANAAAVLWSAAMFAWFFISALYLQGVLGYDAMQVGLAFLPSNLVMAALSIGASARIVQRWGYRGPMAAGLLFAALGLALFARAPVEGRFVADVLAPMLLLGLGAGIAFNPMMMAAMAEVPAEDAGLASGIVNTSFLMGGSLGLAVLGSAAAARTAQLAASGDAVATTAGYALAFALGALCALLAMLSSVLMRARAVQVQRA